MKEYAYHQWAIADILRHFEVDLDNGLSGEKASFRLQNDGPNSLEKLNDLSALKIFLRQFSNFFIWLLLCAGIISYFVDGPIQAAVLFVIVLINLTLGFFQEYKAERALSELKKSFLSECRVLRDGKIIVVSSEKLVPGDIVLIESGDKIPADLRLIDEESLRVDEAALTGESIPVSKGVDILPLETALADRRNMLYGSTIVSSGHGKGVVVATGRNSEFGKIAGMVSQFEEKTPLEKRVLYLGKMMTVFAVALSLIIFLLGYWRHFEIWQLLTFTIALLVAVVPESLPTAITMSLAIGVSRMARKKAIVRRMAVIEALGSTDVIATDKTGTLTDNNLVVDKALLYLKGQLQEFKINKTESKNMELNKFFAHGLACSNVDLTRDREEYLGDPLEVAIAESAEIIDKLARFKAKKYERLMEIPFDSDKKYMAVLVRSGQKKSLIVKGMPEKILAFCDLSVKEKGYLERESINLSKAGYKIIALADKHLGSASNSTLSGMEFKGLFAIVDELSAGVKEAISKTIAAGIRPVIITGDHPETARFIASSAGLKVADDEIVVSDELSKMSRVQLVRSLGKVKIFARVTPAEKIQLVKLMQDCGYSVAMTGDGVNDAPALREAQVGIAMGIKGTDVAKESADIILSDDKYSTIVSAVEYGRSIYDNIKNTIVFLISGNLDEISLVVAAFLFNLPLPFITLQILWINLVTDSLPALALSFENPSRHLLKEKPRSASADSIKESVIYSLYLAGASFILGLGVYIWGLTHSVARGRTLVFCFVVFLELVYALSIRSKKRIWQDPKSFLENKFLLVAVATSIVFQSLIFIEPARKIFKIELLNVSEIFVLILATVVCFFAAEGIRFFLDRQKARR